MCDGDDDDDDDDADDDDNDDNDDNDDDDDDDDDDDVEVLHFTYHRNSTSCRLENISLVVGNSVPM